MLYAKGKVKEKVVTFLRMGRNSITCATALRFTFVVIKIRGEFIKTVPAHATDQNEQVAAPISPKTKNPTSALRVPISLDNSV